MSQGHISRPCFKTMSEAIPAATGSVEVFQAMNYFAAKALP
jgi:hypothetical protein